MNNDNLNLNLLNGGSPFIKKKKRSPQKKKTSLSKEYKVFLKKSLSKNKDHKKNVVQEKNVVEGKNVIVQNTPPPVLNTPSFVPDQNTPPMNNTPPIQNVPIKPKNIKDERKKYVKIVKVNKNSDDNFVKIVSDKDIHKSKNKFTKKSQEKKNKRNSKRKKIHRRITKVKRLSFKCNDNKLDVKKLMQETQKKSNKEIKEELKKKGIDIKSDKNKLLKDLYLFTSCNNINIVRE